MALPAPYTSLGLYVMGDVVDAGQHFPMEGHAYDLSASGARLELDQPVSPGAVVGLRLQVPGAVGDIVATARVVWLSNIDDDPGPRRMAVEFTHVPGPSGATLSGYLRSRGALGEHHAAA